MYDKLADFYHLIFKDWDASIEYQSGVIGKLLPRNDLPILDCACGIGTQAIAVASLGYNVHACDLSAAAASRAKEEAQARGFAVRSWQDDMRHLSGALRQSFGTVLCFDNSLPHLDSEAEISEALRAMQDRLVPGGKLLISLRDYQPLMAMRPSMYGPVFHDDGHRRRIVHQVWSWRDQRRYDVSLFLTVSAADGQCDVHQFDGGAYRAVTPQEVASLAQRVGLREVDVLDPSETGFYQPIILARA
jgi:SAM-dependent methyltransferase